MPRSGRDRGGRGNGADYRNGNGRSETPSTLTRRGIGRGKGGAVPSLLQREGVAPVSD